MSLMIPDPPPRFAPLVFPELPTLALTDDERGLITRLQSVATAQATTMALCDAYYRGEQVITNLRIAIPAELEFLRTIVGWPAMAVDPLVERLSVDGFRLPGATDADADLQEVWLLNRMDSEQSLLFKDAFSMGRGWFTVGSPDEKGDVPNVCVESPLNMAAEWDYRTGKPAAVLQSYWLAGERHAVLYLPNETIHIAQDMSGTWQLVNRDQHNFGVVPCVRMANAARTNERDGTSEITPAVRSITDAACRTLLGLEVAREFYSVPQKIILGATESDFVAADGTARTAWQTYISAILGLERDENGDLPEVKQLTPYDPSVFTKLIEMYAGQMGGIIAANPQELGLYTQGNPVSADAQQVVDARRVRRAKHKTREFTGALVETMQIVGRFLNSGTMPDEYRRMAVDWLDPADLNLAAVTDAMQKQAGMGAVPGSSDAVLRRLGWTSVERAQLAQDRDDAQQLELELADSMAVKAARAAKSVAADLSPTVPPVA